MASNHLHDGPRLGIKLLRLLMLLVPLGALMILVTPYSGSAAPEPVISKLTLKVPLSAALGEPISLEATLEDGNNQPISKAAITFYNPASFLSGSSGLMRVGDAVTNQQGIAILEYIPRRNGESQIIAEYKGDPQHAASNDTVTLNVTGSGEGHYEAEAGLKVPGLNKWVLVGILGAVWGTMIYVGHLIVRIALSSPD